MIRSIYTTLLYMAVFLPSLFFTNLAEKYANKKKMVFVICSAIAILIPTLFAGFRGEEVGTDLIVYAVPEFNKCISCGSWSEYLNTTSTDIGYAFIVALSAFIGKSCNWLLILTELLQILPIYITAYRLRNRTTMCHVMLAFFCLNYTVGFNIMRQSIAASFLLLSYVEIINKNYKNGIICIAVSSLFHSTAVVGILYIVIGLTIYAIKKKWLRNLIIFLGIATIIFLMIDWKNLAYFTIYSGIFPAEKLQAYIDVFSGVNTGIKSYMFEISFSQYLEVLLKGLYLIVPTLCIIKKSSKHRFDVESLKKDRLVNSIIFVALIGVLINYMVLILFHSAYGYRFALYAEYFFVILIPLACGKHRITSKSAAGLSIKVTYSEAINYGMLFISFYVLFMYFGQHETLPFYFQVY